MDAGTAYATGAEGLKQGIQIANQATKIAGEAYKLKSAKEKLRQVAKPKYTATIHLTNSTPIMWTLPQAYFKQGTADHTPPLRVYPRTTVEWQVNSYVLVGMGVEGVICYTVAPGKALVVVFRVKRVSLTRMRNSWNADIVDTAKTNVNVMQIRKRMHQQLMSPNCRHPGNCSSYEKTSFDQNTPLFVIGAMANSETPQLLVEVREGSARLFNRSMSAPQMPSEVPPVVPKKLASRRQTLTDEMHSVEDSGTNSSLVESAMDLSTPKTFPSFSQMYLPPTGNPATTVQVDMH